MEKKLSVYYHIWSPNNTDLWKLMVDEQLKRIYRSGLTEQANVYCGINGPKAFEIANFVSLYDWVNIREISTDELQYEGFTLKYLYEDCQNNPELEGVLYFHTKGISHLCGAREVYSDRRFRAINSWRHLMEWGCLDKWEEAVDSLKYYQVAGTAYCIDPWPHMSGNFWWARPDYIKALIHPITGQFPNDSRDFGPRSRMLFEKWIGLNNPSCFSFYNPPFSYNKGTLKPDIIPNSGDPDWFWLYRDDIEPYYRGEK